jgi:predicted GH43/DUF377 family glycosyl hydrolase
LRRGNSWMFGPEAAYERVGDVNDVVFHADRQSGRTGTALTFITV